VTDADADAGVGDRGGRSLGTTNAGTVGAKRAGGGRRCNALRIGERRASATKKKMRTETETDAREADDSEETETTLVCVRTWDEKELVDAARVSAGSAWKPGGIGGGFGVGGVGLGPRVAGSPGRGEIRQSVQKVARSKGVSSGRKYTSKYRGVHQTFPTGRWEAQFRRNGKPTSLGCFDREEEAAKAYDRMMLWCEMHASQLATSGVSSPQKQGAVALNFDVSTYANDLHALEHMSQDDLMLELRRLGRVQASGAVNFLP